MKGNIFNIQKFSIHDGPGIRTTVFLKGCPLRCKWCANPESQSSKIQVLHNNDLCVKCLHCVDTCPKHAITFDEHIIIDHNKCDGCLKCVKECPTHAISNEGEYKSVEEVVETCLQDVDFYEESNGGVTISGGEGMSQPAFLNELLPELKKHHIHLAIETTGFVSPEVFHELAPQFDLLLFDVKQAHSDKHQKGTGVKNDLIIENLKWAHNQGIDILPRIPVIPGFNDLKEDADEISDLLVEIGLKKVQLLPFHQLGSKKYQLLNKDYELEDVKQLKKEDLLYYQEIFLNKNIDCFF